MIQNSNIIKCKKCQAPLIIKELDIHIVLPKQLLILEQIQNQMNIMLFDGKSGIVGFSNG
jgi:hypothetical protein